MTFNDLQRLHPEKMAPVPPLEDVGERITAPIKPGLPDLIPGLVPTRGQLVIAGETDIGKSLVALEICSALMNNTPLWGELQPNIKAKKILYILGEHYNDVIKRLLQVTKLPMSDDVWLLGPEELGTDKWLVQNGRQMPEAIHKMSKWAEGCDLVVFDPLAAFFVGTDSENDNPGMRVVLESMSMVTQAVGASSLILAHQGKPAIGKDGQEFNRTKYAIRGASSVEDAATNIFYMGHLQGSSQAAEGSSAQKLFSIRKRKYKGDAPDEYKLMRHRDTLTHTILGNRPYIEARRVEVQAKMSRLQAAHPDMKHADVLRILAAVEGLHENTIRNYIGS